MQPCMSMKVKTGLVVFYSKGLWLAPVVRGGVSSIRLAYGVQRQYCKFVKYAFKMQSKFAN